MYPLEMDPLMRELCKFHEKVWRKDHPEGDSDLYAVEIAKAFLQSAAERGLARLVKDAEGDLNWEATPKIFCDLGELHIQLPEPSQNGDEPADSERNGRTMHITLPEEVIRDLDWMTEELLNHADDMEKAIEVFHALRQRDFDLLDAIGEGPFKGIRPVQAEPPERNLSEPPPNE